MSQSSRRSQTICLRVFTSGSPAPLLQGLNVWHTLGLIEAVDITGVTIASPSTGPLQRAVRLEISTTQPTPDLWQGLQTWADLGLLTDIKLVVDLTTSTTHDHLLQGLDTLLTLGLLSASQVQDLCQTHLTCVLPLPRLVSADGWATPVQLGNQQKAASTLTPSAPTATVSVQRPAKPPRSPNPFAIALSSLMAELSVRWLLFLGVFLVISSSSVLAASQWQRFPVAGQYLTLLVYTLMFWAASLWASGQSGLTLTAQTLRLVTLLLIPINFWAMDTFDLWRSLPLLGIGVVAAIVLGGITWQLVQSQPAPRTLPLINFLLLSGLHWGWRLTGWPGIAIYGGAIVTALLTAYQTRSRLQAAKPRARINPSAVWATVTMASLLILLGRAVALAEVPITSLGLALGICGFLIAWLDWQYRPERLRLLGADWEVIGLVGLALGWLLAVVGNRHGQVLAILALAGWGFGQRLVRSWLRRDLLTLAGIGLHGFTTGWLLIPSGIREAIVSTCAQWTGLSGSPIPLLSVGLLPYLAVLLAATGWLHRQDKLHLARFGDWLTLGLGGILTLASTVNPALQTLNLAGSTGLLLWATVRRLALPTVVIDEARFCLYLTHVVGLASLLSGLHWALPMLNAVAWSVVLLGVMALEWMLVAWNTTRNDRSWLLFLESAWYLGLALASIAYLLLLRTSFPIITSALATSNWADVDFSTALTPMIPPLASLPWLITPLMLGVLASQPRFLRHSVAGWLSVCAVLLAQPLSLGFAGIRLWGLAIGLGIMVHNTAILHHWLTAGITIGLALAVGGAALAEGRLGIAPSLNLWLMALAIALTLLWLVKIWSSRYNRPLVRLYGWALDSWAGLLCGCELYLLTASSWRVYGALPATSVLVVAGALTMLAPAYRSWQPPRRSSHQWLSIVVMGVVQLALVEFSRTRLVALAIATVLMIIHTHLLRQTAAAVFTIGYGLALSGAILVALPRPAGADWWLVPVLAIVGLWLGRDWLRRRPNPWAQIYATAADGWAIILWGWSTVALTAQSIGLHWEFQPGQTLLVANVQSTIAATLMVFALAYRAWQALCPVARVTVVAGSATHPATGVPNRVPGWLLYGLAWNLEIAVAAILSLTDSSLLYLAIANIALGLGTQLLGDWWQRCRPADAPPMPSVHVIPLIYAGLGSFFRWGQFTNWTGLTTLGLSLVAIGVGKRRPALKPFVYLGMVGISLGLYEFLLFQLLQVKGDTAGDGFIAMAALAATLTYAYRLLSPWLQHYLSITEDDVDSTAHLHWGLGSLLLAVATIMPVSLYPLWFGVALLLVRYAFFQGRDAPQSRAGELWVWVAIAEAGGMAWYSVSTPLGSVLYPVIAPFISSMACVLAYFGYRAPWAAWGWHPRPLLLTAIVVPLVTMPQALSSLYPPNILIPAAFYLVLAYQQRQIRFTYISLGLAILLLWRWLDAQGNHDPLWYALAIGISLLYVVQTEPILKPNHQRGSRFLLRLIGTLAICAMPLLRQTAIGLVPAGLGLVAIIAGLGLRVRAYLLVGAATFLLTVLYQLGMLIFEYPLTKWILGLLAGISLLYISATFETRRDQMLSFMRQWLTELNNWD